MPDSDEQWQEFAEAGYDFTQEVAELRAHLHNIPKQFHPYIEDGSIISRELPQAVREAYLQWREEQEQLFRELFEKARPAREQAIGALSEKAADIFQDTLHDGEVIHIERTQDNVELLLNMSGGFTSKAIVRLKFVGVREEGQIGRFYIYDELHQTEQGFALRVLWEGPEEEWTVYCTSIEADYFFRPVAYFERDEQMDFQQYMTTLNKAYQYFFITDIIIPWRGEVLQEREDGIYCGAQRIAHNWMQCIEHLYCDTYEDPYAIFSEPVPFDELEAAALSNDLEWQVRAFNTFYASGAEVAPIVNRVLEKIQVLEQNELLVEITAEHFEKLGVLSEAAAKRWLK